MKEQKPGTGTGRFIIQFALVALIWSFLSHPAFAATFNVTSAWCTGPDSIIEAIDNANASAGADTISIQPGLTIRFNTCPNVKDLGFYSARVQESVTIEGNGATLQGQQTWVSLSGVINPGGCPSELPGVVVTSETPGFLRIGDRSADNSAIKVKVHDLKAADIPAFARVYEGAQLELENVHLIDIQDANRECSRSAIEGFDGSSISLVDSTVENFKNYGSRLLKNIFSAVLSASRSSVYVKDSHFSKRFSGSGGAIYASSSDVTIVSSWFLRAGGFSFIGSADAPAQSAIVNSVIQVDGTADQFDRIYSAYYSNVDIQASTIVSDFGTCGACPPDDSKTLPLYAEGGVFNLSETAVGVWGDYIPGGALLYAENGGGYTADSLTYVQPVAGQDAASLRALTGQPALLTDPPALPGQSTGLTLGTPAGRVEFVTPLAPGVLIDKVQDAGDGGSHELRDPFDGTVITKDVFGNDRVDANGSRNIGAVQLALAPSLHAVSGDAAVTLEWTRPQEPTTGSIQGYDLCSSEAGMACALWLPVTDNPDFLTLTLTQLNDGSNLVNGSHYDFVVRARYGPPLAGPFGPESNLVTETPFGAIETPVLTAVPGDTEVTLNWTKPSDGGHGILGYAVWYRLAGSAVWSPWPFVQGGDTLQTKVTGLVNGVEWEFSIRAITPDSLSSDMATALATPWPIPSLSYASPVTVFENSIVSISPNVAGLSSSPLFLLNGGALPNGLQLDNVTGQISGLTAAASTGTYPVTVLLSQAGLPGVFDVTASLEIQVIAPDAALYLHYPDIDVAAGAGPLDVAPAVTGTQGGTLSYAMATGDVLPAGLVLDPATGRITGVPTTATDGFRGLSVEVSESGDPPRLAVSPLIVRIRPTLSYDPVDAEVGDPITISPIVSASAVPGTFSIDAGVLPFGMSFDSATGVVSGTPEAAQFEILTITFTMTGGQTQQVSGQLLISVTDYTIVFSYPQQPVVIGQPFSLLPTVSGTKGPVTFVPDNLPPGVTLDPDSGEISGIMTSALANQVIPISLTDSYNTQRTVAVLEGTNSNTESLEVIPTLSRHGLALMAFLMLVVGCIGFRRVV